MDMPISQINARLFSRLPTDFGLGLLFATGAVSQVVYASGDRPIQFMLRHAGYALRCKIAPGTDFGFKLTDGQIVRATGHLSFSSQSAQFHLFVRDMELLEEALESPQVVITEIQDLVDEQPIVDRKNHSLLSQPVKLALGEIPDWVFALAPDEVRAQDFRWGTERVKAALQQKIAGDFTDHNRLDQNEKLLAFLLESLEKSEHQDIVLTSEMLAQFRTDVTDGSLSTSNNRLNHSEARSEIKGEELAQLPSGPWLFIAMMLLLVGAVLISLYLLVHFGVL
ncbi:MAG: hypothetical protein JXA42_16870 [Anaerolineales bacterium]|nr:hypothetical protein [Anaerolineales bacterium]